MKLKRIQCGERTYALTYEGPAGLEEATAAANRGVVVDFGVTTDGSWRAEVMKHQPPEPEPTDPQATPRMNAAHTRGLGKPWEIAFRIAMEEGIRLEKELTATTAEKKELSEALDTYRLRLAKAIGGWKTGRALIEHAVSDLIATDTIDGSEPSETAQILEREVARFMELTDTLIKESTDLMGCVQGNDYGTLRDTRQRLLKAEWELYNFKLSVAKMVFWSDPYGCGMHNQETIRKGMVALGITPALCEKKPVGTETQAMDIT